jgi:hypothetical protein
MLLKYGLANAKLVALQKKLGKKVYTLSTLAGIGCPGAKDCHSRAVETPEGLRIQDGPHTLFRCFSASQEVLFPSVYKNRKNNREAILACENKVEKIVELFLSSMPKKAGVIRYHVSGDWFTQNHFDAALRVAELKPEILFYCYTKSIPFWVKRKNDIPTNFVLTASLGGKYDGMAIENGLRTAKVVYSQEEADKIGLPVDHDDSYAANPYGGDFLLILHGVQKSGTEAGKAWNKIKSAGGGYSRKKVGV